MVGGSCIRESQAADDGDNAFACVGGLPKALMVEVWFTVELDKMNIWGSFFYLLLRRSGELG